MHILKVIKEKSKLRVIASDGKKCRFPKDARQENDMFLVHRLKKVNGHYTIPKGAFIRIEDSVLRKNLRELKLFGDEYIKDNKFNLYLDKISNSPVAEKKELLNYFL